MPVLYTSETLNWSSDPKTGNPHGSRNIVKIVNGKGEKIKEILNDKGHVTKHHTQTLKRKEISNIVNGQFVPGLWFGMCTPRISHETKSATPKKAKSVTPKKANSVTPKKAKSVTPKKAKSAKKSSRKNRA
jgi:hypothetical protein